MRGIGRSLTPKQELACALRVLAPSWQENLAGHITWAADDGTLLCNPWGIWWAETRAGDIMTLTPDGDVLDGPWDVTPAVHLHTELHRARPDARVVIHNHPYHATLLACLGELPVISHQNSCLLDGRLAFVDEYDGTVESAQAGQWLAERVGDAAAVLLANHGAIVTGATIGEACYRAEMLERTCRFAVDALRSGRKLRSLPDHVRPALRAELDRNTPSVYWHGAVRQLLAAQPDVLTQGD